MRQLCAGILDCGNAVWSVPTHHACIDATSASFLASTLLARHLETATHNAGATSCRHVVFPHLTDLRAALLAPSSVQRLTPAEQAKADAVASAAERKRLQAEEAAKEEEERRRREQQIDTSTLAGQAAGVLAKARRQVEESGDFSQLADAAESATNAASAAVSSAKKRLGIEESGLPPSFVADTANEILADGSTYARGEDKLCATAAFVFYLIPSSSSSSSSTSGPSGSSSSNSSSQVPHHVALWTLCHISADTVQHAGQRGFELACAAHVLRRWAELCLSDGVFKQLSNTAPGQSSGASSRFAAAEGLLGWVAAALEESKGDFGDARHASLEPNLRE